MNPTTFTLGEAARRTGKSKTTISKALKAGKLSYVSRTSAGYEIDPAELARVYPLTVEDNATVDDRRPATVTGGTEGDTPAEATLRAQVEGLRDQLDFMRSTMERQEAAAREVQDDLRGERDRWRTLAERLAVTDERPKRRGWFGLRRAA